MGAVHSVCEVATQTLNTVEYTKTYYVRVSVDGVTWNKTYQENKTEKVNYNLVLPMGGHLSPSDIGERVPCFDSCQLIKTLMSNMCALSV